MFVKAIVGGKVIRLKLSAGLAEAWQKNKGQTMTDQEAIVFVEQKRRERAFVAGLANTSRFALEY